MRALLVFLLTFFPIATVWSGGNIGFLFMPLPTDSANLCMSGSPSPGTQCLGGAIYVGSLSPGATSGSGTDHYMTTPGGCTDSSTPTCSGTDSLTKIWRGSSGSDVDIPGLADYAGTAGIGNGAINTDANYGSDNTALIVEHASISSDSAADWCNNLIYGGYSDWYLPNRYEMNLIFTNKALIPGLNTSGSLYFSSTQYLSSSTWGQRFSDGLQTLSAKSNSSLIRCVRRYTMPDYTPSAMNWLNFNNTSTSQSFAGINQPLSIRLSATYGTGTPTIEYRSNGGSWVSFTPGSPATISVSSGDSLEFKVSGSEPESATITVTNLSDDNAVIDTVTGTVLDDPCMSGSPSPGTLCLGGVYYAGSLSPGATSGSGTDHYMTTPGGCTDSSTPTCSGTDSLTKIWQGSSGSSVDIPGLTTYSTTTGLGYGAVNTDDQYGDYNTATIISHASISSDSAADWCNNLVYGGYSDWFLPNRYELNLIFTNKTVIPGLDNVQWYLSSTEYSSVRAWLQRYDGTQVGGQGSSKTQSLLVRCMRRYTLP